MLALTLRLLGRGSPSGVLHARVRLPEVVGLRLLGLPLLVLAAGILLLNPNAVQGRPKPLRLEPAKRPRR
eukprot:11350442-Alexandrium_andersonii.AAC.1